jgi:endonuclease/exonuclease/phosphatase family metal-dependent hydrolase
MRRLTVVVLLAGCLAACGSSDPVAGDPDARIAVPTDGYPAPRGDLVGRVGTPGAIDIAAWNVENFPKSSGTTALLADLITSLDLDLVAMQEVESIESWNELVARLPDHDGILSSHTYGNGSYQKVGFIYRRDLLSLTTPALLFDANGYEFPRPPLRVHVTVTGASPQVELTVITLHLKAGTGFEDRSRRTDAVQMLEAYVRQAVDNAGEQVLMLGDFNEVLTTSAGMSVMAPFLDATSRYKIRTLNLANSGQTSFIPSGAILDHVITTSNLDDEMGTGSTVIPRVDYELTSYESVISDHLPVVSAMPVLQ